jgi:hypothetical protein
MEVAACAGNIVAPELMVGKVDKKGIKSDH